MASTTDDNIYSCRDDLSAAILPEHPPECTPEDDETVESMLEREPYLRDLHTHLLGMGNTGFWIDSIIEKRQILPTHSDFGKSSKIRKQLCPLIWNNQESRNGAFINGEHTAMFFENLIRKNYPRCSVNEILGSLDGVQYSEVLEFHRLIGNHEFVRQLKHYKLFFGQSNNGVKIQSDGDKSLSNYISGDFTYDVVLTLSDLGKGLGINIPWISEFEDLIQSKVEEKLGLHTYQQPNKSSDQPADGSNDRPFRRWIVFNARNQVFDVVKGITIETLRKYIAIEANAPAQKCSLARAHIQNAFSMCNPDGTDPRPIDFDRFHGSFTPEFYPRRFALKDSLYSQRLDILAALLIHILRRYQSCLPPIRYCELSIGVGDLCRPWVFDVLCSFPAYERLMGDTKPVPLLTSFRKMIQTGYFPHLRNACPKQDPAEGSQLSCIPNVTYKFLAGFNRQTVVEHRLKNQTEAFRLLNDSPDVAIHYMLEQIAKSEEEEGLNRKGKLSEISTEEKRDKLFSKALEDLEKLEVTSTNPAFSYWVVGLDLFGDEMGYPYCPFVAWPFIRYIRERRQENEKFGLRIHCGENVPFADIDAGAYRHFIAHMYIVFRCLRFLQRKLTNSIRIGHGVAFARILSNKMSKSTHRKSSVLLAEMQDHAEHLLTKIVFEINITSNEYLLGPALREGNPQQTIRLDALTRLKIPIILATDDDGIWPIDYCASKHPGHHSLVAEYCRAFSLSLIISPNDLRNMLDKTKDACFYSSMGKYTLSDYRDEDGILPKDDKYASAMVFHPDLIKTIMGKYVAKNYTNKSLYQYYLKLYPPNRQARLKYGTKWDGLYDSLARFVFMQYYYIEVGSSANNYENEYHEIFGHEPPFNKIYAFWDNVWSRFMYPPDKTTSNHIGTGPNGPVFLSESSHHENQELPYLFERLTHNHFRRRDIRVFTREISKPIEMVQKLNEILQNHHLQSSIKIFTTKNKDVYTDSASTNDGLVAINENSMQRTNYYGDSEEHILYVICRHGSAATAYLHYLGLEIKKSNEQNRANLHSQQSVNTGDQEEASGIRSPSSASVQPNDTNS